MLKCMTYELTPDTEQFTRGMSTRKSLHPFGGYQGRGTYDAIWAQF